MAFVGKIGTYELVAKPTKKFLSSPPLTKNMSPMPSFLIRITILPSDPGGTYSCDTGSTEMVTGENSDITKFRLPGSGRTGTTGGGMRGPPGLTMRGPGSEL